MEKTMQSQRPTVMVVDDEFSIRESFGLILGDNYKVLLSASGEAALKKLADEKVDVVYLDIRMPGMDGLETLKRLKGLESDVTVIMVTAVNDVQKAGEAIKLGAKDYIVKPFDVDAILKMTERVLKKKVLSKETKEVRSGTERNGEDLIGASKPIEDLRALINDLSQKGLNVLILGEAGVEKGAAARLIHAESKRGKEPLIAATFMGKGEDEARSMLFGKGSGSFAATLEKESGLLEAAEGGTLYIQNIESLPSVVQKELAAAIMKGEFVHRDLGTAVKIDVRIIGSSTADLKALISEGRFSKELYEAIATSEIVIPPLKQRSSDIAEMARYFVDKFNGAFARSVKGFTKDSLEALQGYPFPGNVDELENIVEGIIMTFDGVEIPLSKLPLNVLLNSASVKGLAEAEALTFDSLTDKLEKAHIERMLLAAGGDTSKAARSLGLLPNSLSAKMESLKISV